MTTVLRRALALLVSTCVIFSVLIASADAATTPSPATGVKISAGESTAVVSWTKAAGAVSYRVCLRTVVNQTPCTQLSKPSAATTATFRGLTRRTGTDYYVVVYSYRAKATARSAPRAFELKAPPVPAVPTGISQKVTAGSLSVTWAAASGAETYAVCLMEVETTEKCSQISPRSATRSVRLAPLASNPGTDFYYRVYAYNKNGSSRSAKQHADMPVMAVLGVTVTPGPSGTARVSWTGAQNAETYEVQISTNSTLTRGVKSYKVSGTTASLSNLVLGQRYYYRVRGINGVRTGAFTRTTFFHLPTGTSRIFVVTYNLCGQDKCVTPTNGMRPWSMRKKAAGALVRSAAPDIIATQESHSSDTKFGTELPGFGLAAYYSAKSLFYKTSKYDVLRSGTITLDSTHKKYAVWAEFRDKSTRTTFIVADVHLQPYKGKANDDLRAAQTTRLLRGVKAINTQNLPVIYAGDFNSNKNNKTCSTCAGGYDAPLNLFTAAGIDDSFNTSELFINQTWNSANQAMNPPRRNSDHVDHVFVDPSIEVESWKIILALRGSSYQTPFPTDHNPVRVIVRVPGR